MSRDLESFFYILIWAAVTYDLKTKTRRPLKEDSLLHAWSPSSDEASLLYHSLAKLDFLRVPETYRGIFGEVQPEFAHMFNKWIKPLHALFSQADGYAMRNWDTENFEPETFGGILTFERFMAAIGEMPRSFDTVLVDDAE